MSKNKHIKVDLRQSSQQNLRPSVPVPAVQPIPDLILNFHTGTKVYTMTIPSAEMGRVAELLCELMKMKGIKHSLEEKPR